MTTPDPRVAPVPGAAPDLGAAPVAGAPSNPCTAPDPGVAVDELLADGSVLLDVLFGRTLMGVAVFDRNLVLRTCNETWARFVERHGVVSAADVVPGRGIFDYFPGTETKILPAAAAVLAGETRWYDAVPHDRRDGSTSYWDLMFVPLWKDGEVIGVVDVSIDATDRYQAERELRHSERRFQFIRTEAEAELARRDAILEAVRFAAHRFLESHTTSWRTHIGEVMARLGQAAAVSRVYIFENFEDAAGTQRCSQSHEWVATGIEAQIDNPELQAFTYAEIDFTEPAGAMAAGAVVASRVAEMGPARAVLEAQGIVSIVLVPIFVQDRWWGFMGFDECVRERNWPTAEIDALRAATSTLSAAIHRQYADDLLREQQELLAKRVSALSAIAASLSVNQTLADTMDVIAECVVAATSAVASTAYVLEPDTGDPRVAAAGLPEGYRAGLEQCWRDDPSITSSVAFLSDELRISRHAVRHGLANPRLGPLHEHLRRVDWDTVVFVPLGSDGRRVGSVNAYYPRDLEPTPDELAFLRAVADQAAVAVENARLLAEAQSKAGLEERQRLARELHDSVSQALYGIALGARTARSLAEHSPEKLAEPLDYVLSLADAGMTEMRSLIFALRPESLATEGLVAALEKQVAVLRTRHGITVRAGLGTEPAVPLAVKEALYRIGQEALHNTVRHAHARHVEVRLSAGVDEVVLEVGDDGIGFDPRPARPGHLGLQSMRERATAHRGSVQIDSRIGAGTTVRVRLPLARQAAR
ncbi:MAG: histidine kinase [Actinomycetota bacterium]|nr:histidine kinase [Actinomycetota bacterium]